MTNLTREEVLRKIVHECQHQEIDGVLMDMTTANMLCKIMDNLGSENKANFLALPLLKMVDIGWKLIK